ncbi:MAG: DUF2800 domain-containing protein [Eubacterium sp.]
MPSKHAKLSPSSAARWLKCTPSIRMEEGLPNTTNDYAEEGTLAHLLGEKTLLYRLGSITARQYAIALKKVKANALYKEEMMEYINGYVDFVLERYEEAKSASELAVLNVELRLDVGQWAKGSFGTGDAVIVTDGYVQVIDLKYGQGIPVSVDKNPQLMLYGLGAYAAYDFLFDIDQVVVTVYQPRIGNIASLEITKEILLEWADEVVRPQAEKAIKGEGDFVAGSHCKYCKVEATCRARQEYNLELLKMDYCDPELLSDEELAEVLSKADDLVAWVKSVQDYVLSGALKGKKFKGLKLVAGRSNRLISEPDQVKKILISEGFQESDICVSKINGITKLEKIVGKKRFEELVGGFITKPVGKPTIAFEDDSREEYNSALSDFKEGDN